MGQPHEAHGQASGQGKGGALVKHSLLQPVDRGHTLGGWGE